VLKKKQNLIKETEMNMWNKQIAQAVLCLGVLSLTPSDANAYGYCNDPCNDPCDVACEDFSAFGGFDIGADFLYWKPCVDDLFVAQVTNENVVERKSIDPKWEPGVRVKLAKPDMCGCFTLSGSYTWLKSNDHKTITNEAGVLRPIYLPDSIIGANVYTEIGGTWDTTYQTFDVLLSYNLRCNDCQTLTPFFGVEGLILNQKLNHNYSIGPVLQTASWDSDFFGAGFKMGLEHDLALSDCFALFAAGSGSIAVGTHDVKTTVTGKIYKDDVCLIVPGYHLQAGLKYEADWCGMEFAIRAGYEMLERRNTPNMAYFFGDDQRSSPSTTTLGFHGGFLGLDVQF
jgi:hypothetical protein